MRLDYNSPEALAPVIEALVFASDEPLAAQELRSLILGEEQPKTSVEEEAVETAQPAEDAPQPVGEPVSQPVGEPVAEPGAETPSIDTEAVTTSSDGTSDEQIATEPVEVTEVESAIVAPKKQRKRKQLIELSTIKVAIEQLNARYQEENAAFRIVEIAGGYQFATRPEHAEYVARLFKEKSRRRLSGAALETLAIIAYKQPVSKLDVENIRGVNCDEVLKSLLEKNLITITGRAEAVGRPLLYGTTVDFLRHFGLPEIGDLPKPREIEELMKEEAIRATTLDEAAQEYFAPDQEDVLTIDEVLISANAGENVDTSEYEESESAESMMGIELDVEAMEMNTAEAEQTEAEITEPETTHDQA